MADLKEMVQQIIKYKDGSETVINYRGRIVNGELVNEEVPAIEEAVEESVPEPELTEEVVEESVEEATVSEVVE